MCYFLVASWSVNIEFTAASTSTDSDHLPVLVTLKLNLKRSVPVSNKCFIQNLSLISDKVTSQKFAAAASQLLRVCPSDPESRRSVNKVQECSWLCSPRSPWTMLVCQETMDILGNTLHYAGPRKRSLRHDKQPWAEQIFMAGNTHKNLVALYRKVLP